MTKINRRGLKTYLLSVGLSALMASCSSAQQATETTPRGLKDAVADEFLMGVALNEHQIAGQDTAALRLIKQHFNAIVAENCTKSEVIHPQEDVYNFAPTDSLVAFGERNGIKVIGHCLIWHSQLSPWFAVDKEGKPVSAEVLKQRMKDHITTLVSRYKGRIHGWDVVNEAIIEDGSYRKTPFYDILGEEFIPYAFECAHAADPDVELYYNDYGMNVPGRRDSVVKLIRTLKERGLRIDAVGMQGHMGLDYPNIQEFEAAIDSFSTIGVKVMVTEWDMSALPTVSRSANIADKAEYEAKLNPYPEALPDSVSQLWNGRMKAFFDLFRKHADVITRVNVWGLTDGDSWKNDFPVRGRHEYPLLFDRQYQPKPFVKEILDEANADVKTSVQ
jgi:endo-1,4-beta-xylanase